MSATRTGTPEGVPAPPPVVSPDVSPGGTSVSFPVSQEELPGAEVDTTNAVVNNTGTGVDEEPEVYNFIKTVKTGLENDQSETKEYYQAVIKCAEAFQENRSEYMAGVQQLTQPHTAVRNVLNPSNILIEARLANKELSNMELKATLKATQEQAKAKQDEAKAKEASLHEEIARARKQAENSKDADGGAAGGEGKAHTPSTDKFAVSSCVRVTKTAIKAYGEIRFNVLGPLLSCHSANLAMFGRRLTAMKGPTEPKDASVGEDEEAHDEEAEEGEVQDDEAGDAEGEQAEQSAAKGQEKKESERKAKLTQASQGPIIWVLGVVPCMELVLKEELEDTFFAGFVKALLIKNGITVQWLENLVSDFDAMFTANKELLERWKQAYNVAGGQVSYKDAEATVNIYRDNEDFLGKLKNLSKVFGDAVHKAMFRDEGIRKRYCAGIPAKAVSNAGYTCSAGLDKLQGRYSGKKTLNTDFPILKATKSLEQKMKTSYDTCGDHLSALAALLLHVANTAGLLVNTTSRLTMKVEIVGDDFVLTPSEHLVQTVRTIGMLKKDGAIDANFTVKWNAAGLHVPVDVPALTGADTKITTAADAVFVNTGRRGKQARAPENPMEVNPFEPLPEKSVLRLFVKRALKPVGTQTEEAKAIRKQVDMKPWADLAKERKKKNPRAGKSTVSNLDVKEIHQLYTKEPQIKVPASLVKELGKRYEPLLMRCIEANLVEVTNPYKQDDCTFYRRNHVKSNKKKLNKLADFVSYLSRFLAVAKSSDNQHTRRSEAAKQGHKDKNSKKGKEPMAEEAEEAGAAEQAREAGAAGGSSTTGKRKPAPKQDERATHAGKKMSVMRAVVTSGDPK